MTNEELERIEGVARELIVQTTHEIDSANIFTDRMFTSWMTNTRKMAETMLWLCDELRSTETRVREQVAQDLLAVDGFEWALAGQQAGLDAAKIARGNR